MAEAIRPEVMIRQADALAADLREQVTPVSQDLEQLLTPAEWRSAGTVYLTGDGDSYHAACAATMAFETIAGLRCEPVSALPFLEYRALSLLPVPLARPLVIAISASGGTERVVQAIEAARRGGALTIALTGTPGSAVTRAADRSLVISLPQLEPSPGIAPTRPACSGSCSPPSAWAERASTAASRKPRRCAATSSRWPRTSLLPLTRSRTAAATWPA